jgi:hypothetical protein
MALLSKQGHHEVKMSLDAYENAKKLQDVNRQPSFTWLKYNDLVLTLFTCKPEQFVQRYE